MPSSSRKPPTWTPPCQPAAYWPRAVCMREVGWQPDGREHLLLLVPEVGRVEGDRLLHRGERQQLEQVVLDDVAGGADAVVVAGPAADADVLGHGDLHVVDVVGVPDRLEQRVGEAQRQDVLDGLLAEVVVDAEDRPRVEDLADDVVQLPGAGQVVAERLLDDHPAPGALGSVGQAVLLELLDDVGEELRRDRQVEGVVAAGAAGLVELARSSRAAGRRPRRRRSRPATNRMPSLSCFQTSSRNGVRACSLTASWTIWAKSWSAQSRRAKPTRRSPAAAGRGWRGRRSRA